MRNTSIDSFVSGTFASDTAPTVPTSPTPVTTSSMPNISSVPVVPVTTSGYGATVHVFSVAPGVPSTGSAAYGGIKTSSSYSAYGTPPKTTTTFPNPRVEVANQTLYQQTQILVPGIDTPPPPMYVDADITPAPPIVSEPPIVVDTPMDTNDGGTSTDGTFPGGNATTGDGTTVGGNTGAGNTGGTPRATTNTTLTKLKPFLIVAALVGGAIILGKLLKK